MLVLLSAKRQIFQQFSSICLYFLLWLPFSGIPYTGDWKYQLEIYRFKEWGKSSNVWKRKELLWGSGVGGRAAHPGPTALPPRPAGRPVRGVACTSLWAPPPPPGRGALQPQLASSLQRAAPAWVEAWRVCLMP